MSLNDKLRLFHNDTTYIEVNKIEGPTNGRTKRRGDSGKLLQTTAHQLSNENGSIPTLRSNVRITEFKEIGDTGKSAQAYVQFTSSVPRDLFEVIDVQKLAARLINILKNGGDPEQTAGVGADYDTLNGIPRLYNEEG